MHPSPLSPRTAERAADPKLQKAGPVNDSRLSSVPEVPVGVASEPKATQTAPLSHTSPTPSSRQQVQFVICQFCMMQCITGYVHIKLDL